MTKTALFTAGRFIGSEHKLCKYSGQRVRILEEPEHPSGTMYSAVFEDAYVVSLYDEELSEWQEDTP